MKYFLDTEFLEGKQKLSWFHKIMGVKARNTIDLISIGIVAEDGREYYVISKDFNLKEAWNRFDIIKGDSTMVHSIGDDQYEVKNYWIRENVLKLIFQELNLKNLNDEYDNLTYGGTCKYKSMSDFTYKNLEHLIRKYGKSNTDIANKIIQFTIDPGGSSRGAMLYDDYIEYLKNHPCTKHKPTFYAYYADYDWVVFCWLFGKMIDLPKGFPMYCIDLKQTLDSMQEERTRIVNLKMRANRRHVEPITIKGHPDYPKQENEHNALDDAKWNKKLYDFLINL